EELEEAGDAQQRQAHRRREADAGSPGAELGPIGDPQLDLDEAQRHRRTGEVRALPGHGGAQVDAGADGDGLGEDGVAGPGVEQGVARHGPPRADDRHPDDRKGTVVLAAQRPDRRPRGTAPVREGHGHDDGFRYAQSTQPTTTRSLSIPAASSLRYSSASS